MDYWTDAEDDKLIELRGMGCSFGQIALVMTDRSRCALIARYHRILGHMFPSDIGRDHRAAQKYDIAHGRAAR